MKILYHIPGAIVGGAETQVQYLVNSLPKEHSAFITYEQEPMGKFIQNNIKTSMYSRVFSPITIVKKILEYAPDIIQFYHSPLFYDALVRSNFKGRVVEVAHNRTPFGWDSSTYGKDHTDILVCVSPDAETHFLSKRRDCATIIIPNGVDTDKFYPSGNTGVRKRPITGGFCGRLEAGNGKGVDMLTDIMMRISEVDFELVGYDFGNYKRKCVDNTNIRVLPFTDNMGDVYRGWDFFVSCSPKEGFGLAIAEALASGLQCVILDCGGVTNYLKHGEHAYIAKDAADVEIGIRKVIKALSAGKPLFNPLGVDLSAKRMADSYSTLYQKIRDTPPTKEDATPLSGDIVLGVVPSSWQGIKHAIEGRVTQMCPPEKAFEFAKMLRPKSVVFGGFPPTNYPIVKALRGQSNAEIVVTYHSTAVLNEFGAENRKSLVHVIDAMQKGFINYISTPHEGMAKALNALPGVVAVYEPNTLTPINLESKPVKLDGINVGIFGTGLPWKNVDTQILAAAILPSIKKLHLQNYADLLFLDQIGVPYEMHPYFSNRQEFYQLAGAMTINLAVGITETFGYFAAESYILGVPAIFGVTTPSMRGAQGALKKALVTYIDDPSAISDAVSAVLDDYDNVLDAGQEYCKRLICG